MSGLGDGFAPRVSVEQVEEGDELAPKFDADGLIPVVTTDSTSGELLMHGYMNAEALRRTIETGEAHYYSRSRQCLWHKGATSGFVQHVEAMYIDDDQDAVWLRVRVDGGASQSDLLMQFQADMLGVPVLRPKNYETTALGAAYLAGLAVGYWPDGAALERHWQLERRFEPQMPADQANALRFAWREAVMRSRGWAHASHGKG